MASPMVLVVLPYYDIFINLSQMNLVNGFYPLHETFENWHLQKNIKNKRR